jgi:hypothetical protein
MKAQAVVTTRNIVTKGVFISDLQKWGGNTSA